ncbi:hypothetical protein IV203_028035 [Nitzschia inconspicua]|uniref:Uncharacterized protein n=1 Tax=Nitzschia inconspicua TaxID=303405 RepID=A0A9K3Q6M3_9STRA|nr:hypothetical protein IV203_028035 [Nitzschia inconspicua]
MSSTGMPKKYVKINGIMKLNPEYKRWKEAQNASSGIAAPATTVINSDQALPVVSSMEDHMQMNEDLGAEIPLAESTNATIEMLQEPEISLEAGLQPDEMIDQLGALLSKYEVPIGLTNKLMMLSEFASLEFIIDDSGSMMCQSDTIDPVTKRANTRWGEAHQRLKEMLEIIAYVPFQQIGIEFLNRKDRISLTRNGMDPKTFLAGAYQKIDAVFARPAAGTTPALEKLQESFLRGQGVSIARYFFGDGLPNGGHQAIAEITNILKNRASPETNPMTFISCTNEDEAVEWMKDCEEVAPYCSESDDFADESQEVYKDQGAALPYTKGFHLICQLVAAMNPDDLDAMDESVPFTKFTLDNLLGVQNNEESYRHYFNCFVQAQQKRVVETDPRTGAPKQSDLIKKNTQWHYSEFLNAPGAARHIPQVQQVLQQLKALGG